MERDSDSLRRLAVAVATKFVLSSSERILRENDPDRSPGPRLFVAGCPMGNLTHVRHDVSDRTAEQMLHLLAAEPPWSNPEALPSRLLEVMDLLAREMPVTSVEASLIYALPRQEPAETAPRFICSGSDEGAALLGRFQQAGLPRHLIDAGFVSVCDFWPPWCVALDGDAIAAFAFAARLGLRGAEIGVYTFPGWRSRGLAATVTAKWSSLPVLSGRELFYSANVSNTSSQRVAGRLGLRQFAVGLRVT
ncbi:MAG: GNAT family N-acetyltransferase [Xanthobacteraceae bacterium]